jgi:arylsulfatase A-like enzyme
MKTSTLHKNWGISKRKATGLMVLLCQVFLMIPELQAQNTSSSRPNIIYILADDLGYGDLGCYGQKIIQTPKIDRLATEGMRFTQHYAGSTVCAPSRDVLMTGLNTAHSYIRGNFSYETEGNLPIPDSTLTVAEILKKDGYKTGIIGKWGLGGPKSVGGPNNQGFDYSFCYLDQRNAHEYYPEYLWENEEKYPLTKNLNHQQVQYSHDIFTDKALQFVKEHKDEPFFLYLPYTIPHGKYQVPDDAPYSDLDLPQPIKNYAAMITRMDGDIGKIMELLKSS